jgi:hypothetical protein
MYEHMAAMPASPIEALAAAKRELRVEASR